MSSALFFLTEVTTAHPSKLAMLDAREIEINIGMMLQLAEARTIRVMLDGMRLRYLVNGARSSAIERCGSEPAATQRKMKFWQHLHATAPVLCWRTTESGAEAAIEIRYLVEPASKGDLADLCRVVACV